MNPFQVGTGVARRRARGAGSGHHAPIVTPRNLARVPLAALAVVGGTLWCAALASGDELSVVPVLDEGGVAGGVPGACGTTTLSQSTDDTTVAFGVACISGGASLETGMARAFTIAPGAPFVVNCVDFGVAENTGGDFTVTVNLFTGTPTDPYGSLTLLGSTTVDIPDASAPMIYTADFANTSGSVIVPPGSTLVVEVLAPTRAVAAGGDGGLYRTGANAAGESAPTYLRAPVCGIDDFIEIGTAIPGPVHMVMRVDGDPLYWSSVEVGNNTGVPAAGLQLTFSGGGTLFVPPAFVLSPGCPVAGIPSNAIVTDTIDIEWTSNCIEPGDRVVFLLRSASVPLTFTGGVWLDAAGNVIGPIDVARLSVKFLGVLPPPPKTIVAIKRQVRYRGVPVYGPWAKPPGQCWQRWCCFNIGGRICEDRWVLCFFPTRISRLLELGNCIPLTGWRFRRANGVPLWILVVTTIKPPPGDPQDPPGGPPPRMPMFFALDIDPIDSQELEIIDSDDLGESGVESADWGGTFLALHDLLRLAGNDPTLPPVFGLPAIAQLMAPRYVAAAEAIQPVLDAADSVIVSEPVPELFSARNATAQLQQALLAMAEELESGLIVDPLPYTIAGNALRDLGEALLALSGGHQRFANAQVYLDAMADGMDVSAQAVLTGLVTPLQQDAFLWGQVARFQPLCESAGLALLPSEIVQLDLASLPSWGPETVPAHVVLRNADSLEIANETVERLNEFGQLVVSTLGHEGGGPLDVWVKPGTHLATLVPLVGVDGAISSAPTQSNGDADGDNCVDDVDLAQVLDEQGEGGEFAPDVPSSDVNRNGLVEPQDIAIVKASLGLCGEPYPGRNPVDPCPADLSGDGLVDGADLGALLNAWGPCPGCVADLNADGTVDGADLGELLLAWGECERRR